MRKECDQFPTRNHQGCELDRYETIVNNYFQDRGCTVERLCTNPFPQAPKTPDFLITDGGNLQILCEVKFLESPTGALSKQDLEYANRTEFEELKREAATRNTPLIVHPDDLKRWKNEIPYPPEGRNTTHHEQENERKIKALLHASSVAHLPFHVTIERRDPYIWTDEERQAFVDELCKNLTLISQGHLPLNWQPAQPGYPVVDGHFMRDREHGRRIHNHIKVEQGESALEVTTHWYLGINWKGIEESCRLAYGQIKSRLQTSSHPETIMRLIMLFLEGESLIFAYVPEFNKLIQALQRHIWSKHPELSAVAFCEDFDWHTLSQARFSVFHTPHESAPRLPRSVFDDQVSGQWPPLSQWPWMLRKQACS